MPHTHPSPVLPTPWPPPIRPVDLKSFVRNLAALPAQGGATAGQYRRTHTLIESRPHQIDADPLPISGFLDGIQARCLAGRVEHRDITLAYVAAGTVLDTTLLTVEERLAAVCSVEDEPRVRAALTGVPVVALPELFPWNAALATDEWIDSTRRELEAQVLADAPVVPGHFLVVDGALPPGSVRTDAVGVVKDALSTVWLADPDLLPAAGGMRSPALRLPAMKAGERPRLTAFVRLRDATSSHTFGFSLIRVETYEECGIEVLDAAAAMAVSQRQPLGSGDPRAEIQLSGMYRAEQVLKARSPIALEILS